MELNCEKLCETIFDLPVPSTAFFDGPVHIRMPGSNSVLVCDFEGECDDNSHFERLALSFEGVIASKESHLYTGDYDLMVCSYDTVVKVHRSDWLDSVLNELEKSGREIPELGHYCFYPDDGPQYEFICHDFKVFQEAIAGKYFSVVFPLKNIKPARRISARYNNVRSWLDDLNER